jgi:geranylgeranyl reductase family protein
MHQGTSCDVLIVGGGPAGSTCARRLRRRGLDVLVLDRQEFPRDKVCAGWITLEVVRALRLDTRDYAQHRVLQPIRAFRTGPIGGRALENRYAEVVSYGILRREFDHYLLQRAGARLRLGEPAHTFERTDDGWLINGEIRAAMLVGAGGHNCPVARHLGAALGSRVPLVAAREAEFRLDGLACALRPEVPELYFSADLKGYGWCFRKGDWLNVGLGRQDSRDLSGHLKAFLAGLHAQGRVPRIDLGQFKGHAYLLHGHASRPLTQAAALLIGDAAGLAYPQSGEGIGPAVESGGLAAEVIADAHGDYSAANLAAYERRLRSRLGPIRRVGAELPGGIRTVLGRLFLANALLTRKLVLERWFLHRNRPPLEASDISS